MDSTEIDAALHQKCRREFATKARALEESSRRLFRRAKRRTHNANVLKSNRGASREQKNHREELGVFQKASCHCH
jgi:hypothetical protein